MDEILGSVNCGLDRWQVLVRENGIVELNSLYGENAVSTSVILNFTSIEDFRNLSKLFAKATDLFEKREISTTRVLKYVPQI
jgi:hypothetical protein